MPVKIENHNPTRSYAGRASSVIVSSRVPKRAKIGYVKDFAPSIACYLRSLGSRVEPLKSLGAHGLAGLRFGFFMFSSAEDSVWRALRAEAEGFDSVWLPEFVTRRPDGREHISPIGGMSYVAALTRRVKLGTAVIGALKHHPAVLSQEIASVDRLSGGQGHAGARPGG